jgi:hypothetical protein
MQRLKKFKKAAWQHVAHVHASRRRVELKSGCGAWLFENGHQRLAATLPS